MRSPQRALETLCKCTPLSSGSIKFSLRVNSPTTFVHFQIPRLGTIPKLYLRQTVRLKASHYPTTESCATRIPLRLHIVSTWTADSHAAKRIAAVSFSHDSLILIASPSTSHSHPPSSSQNTPSPSPSPPQPHPYPPPSPVY